MHGTGRVSGGGSSVPQGGVPAHVVAGLAVALLPLHLLLPQHQHMQATVMMDFTPDLHTMLVLR